MSDLVARLKQRAEAERVIQRNNEAVADALQGQVDAYNRNDGTHNTFAFRLAMEHRSCAKHDANLAADWDEAAATIERLTASAESEIDRRVMLRDKILRDSAANALRDFLTLYEATRDVSALTRNMRALIENLANVQAPRDSWEGGNATARQG